MQVNIRDKGNNKQRYFRTVLSIKRTMTEAELKNLYPKYNCPKCGDWFHMPFKYCKCDTIKAEEFFKDAQEESLKAIQQKLLKNG